VLLSPVPGSSCTVSSRSQEPERVNLYMHALYEAQLVLSAFFSSERGLAMHASILALPRRRPSAAPSRTDKRQPPPPLSPLPRTELVRAAGAPALPQDCGPYVTRPEDRSAVWRFPSAERRSAPAQDGGDGVVGRRCWRWRSETARMQWRSVRGRALDGGSDVP